MTETDEDYKFATQDFDEHPENNRVLHELFGKCWHEIENRYVAGDIKAVCKKCGTYGIGMLFGNPDYADDPRLILEGMRERKDWREFLSHIVHISCWIPTNWETSHVNLFDLVLDKTGRLRDLAIEFLKEEE